MAPRNPTVHSEPPPTPPQDATDPSTLRIVPLGGLGEVGMNCLALEQGDELLLVDCGVTFPSSDLGIDIYHPRFDHVLGRKDNLRGIVITHGHEDHIGGLPYLLRHVDVPVWGPPHALELVRHRLEEHGFAADDVELIPTQLGREIAVGRFGVEPIRVAHSIVDATALAIRTRAGLIVHTGDFKLDPSPIDGELTDEARLRELGDEGVRLLLSDSTNVDSPGSAGSEQDVGAALQELIESARARVVIGVFASNVHRLLAMGEAAMRTGRRICLLGRSVAAHVRAAQAVGRISWPSNLLIPPEMAAAMPRERILVVAGGTQAERGSGLARLATGTHPMLRLDEGDRVILSSRVIPGNDRPVMDMIAGLLRLGVDLITWITDKRIHASGHAHRAEQQRMIDLTEPHAFIPIHGTLHHLVRHAALARESGVADVAVAENGHVIELSPRTPLERSGKVPVGRVATAAGEELTEEVLRERAQIGRSGVAFVSLVIDAHGALAADPQVVAQGVVDPSQSGALRAAARAVAQAITDADPRRRRDTDLIELARLAARRAIDAKTGRRPFVTVSLTRL
ncbi:ribonuclease J [Chondromyces apiculatus]|uniref:Ribonuclease J2 (Endoribonuclease in RNA processing) n=1 Tax=Chondromyces apiculatus DSM 436 TaxID=1192034 RepID=A0A017SXK6_9BACT|nr:ribonuclease J [Chondromyces apiculatus]EYF01355.1 Ribonuclease J2 (endoribonuclease in RNA processing) [Chondromyces apiculatus DSM 436]